MEQDHELTAEVYSNLDWKGKTIMIVDDHKTTRQYYKIAIQKTEANVVLAQDGEEAINIVKSGKPIDLILMDIHMPKVDGLTATRIIKEINSPTAVIVQTAYTMAGEKDKSYLAGCDAVINKPIKIRELIKTIDIYLR